jgi:hypothetical protein
MKDVFYVVHVKLILLYFSILLHSEFTDATRTTDGDTCSSTQNTIQTSRLDTTDNAAIHHKRNRSKVIDSVHRT